MLNNTTTTKENISYVSCPPFGVLIIGTETSSTIYLTVFCCTCIISIISSALNILVFVALLTSQLRSKKSLLIMLNVGDLIASIILMPLYGVYMYDLYFGRINCVLGRALMAIGYTVTMITCINIVFITIQLYHAIINPFKHRHWSSLSNHVVPLVSFFWIVTSASVSTIVFAFPQIWNLFKSIIGGLMLIIYCTVLISHKRVYTETKQIVKNKHDYKTNGIAMKKKTFKMVSTVMIAFGLSYLPFVVFAVYIGINGINPVLRSFYAPFIELMVLSSALFDPLIYCFRMKSIRSEMMRILKCRCQQNTNTIHDKHRVVRKFKTIKQETGITMNTVNLSILTASITSMSSIRFDHESKYHDTDANNNHQIICRTLSQTLPSPKTSSSSEDRRDTLDKFHREQGHVLKKAKYLYVP